MAWSFLDRTLKMKKIRSTLPFINHYNATENINEGYSEVKYQ